jgi:uncharacterized protein YjdB
MKRRFMNYLTIIILLSGLFLGKWDELNARTYYVAVSGSDQNPGTFELPWGTWQKGFNEAEAGDTVYFRGGTWYPTGYAYGNCVTIIAPKSTPGLWGGPTYYGHSGTADKQIYFLNYPGEIPVLDCSTLNMSGHTFNSGITVWGAQYLVFKGLTVRNVYQPSVGNLAAGVSMSACYHMTFENMIVHDIGGRGIFSDGWGGSEYVPDYDTLRIINCDVYNCFDPYSAEPGNGADGIKQWNFGQNNIVYVSGNRVWNCSDDGFDLGGSCYVEISNNWSWGHCFEGAMDGNGFKFGAVSDAVTGVRRLVRNNIAAFNVGQGGTGFFDLEYASYYRNNSRVYNNTIYKCGKGITVSENTLYPDYSLSVYKNNIVYGTTTIDAGGRPYHLDVHDWYGESHNTWDYSEAGSLANWVPTDSVTVTDADFVSLDPSEMEWPRKADGSLPDINFLKLAPGSDLIDAGTDIGVPYGGVAPDIGYKEFSTMVSNIAVSAVGGSNIIDTDDATLQLIATVTPLDAANREVNWSVSNGTGYGSINSSGLLTAQGDGTVVVRATARDGSGVFGTYSVTILNQLAYVTDIIVTVEGGAEAITYVNETLKLAATVLPEFATDKSITWIMQDESGQATISTDGMVTATASGTITAVAMANDGSGIMGTLAISIGNERAPAELSDNNSEPVISFESSLLTITLQDNTNYQYASVCTILGSVIMHKHLDAVVSVFDLSMLTQGTYILILSGNGSKKSFKFSKQLCMSNSIMKLAFENRR